MGRCLQGRAHGQVPQLLRGKVASRSWTLGVGDKYQRAPPQRNKQPQINCRNRITPSCVCNLSVASTDKMYPHTIFPTLGLVSLPHDGLFDLPAATPAVDANLDSPISPRQIEQVRAAFEAAAITAMDDRQRIIQESTGRKVENIRQLLSREVMTILSYLDRTGLLIKKTHSSAWDDREEDTWIDRL